MEYKYRTQNTCSQLITLELDGDIVHNVHFWGGCDGNAKGICSLIDGMTVEEIEQKCSGITCGRKPTSCPDQLAKAVRAAKKAAEQQSF